MRGLLGDWQSYGDGGAFRQVLVRETNNGNDRCSGGSACFRG